MLDDINELRTYQRILATGSLSAAARELGVAVGVVSKRLISLERRAGVRLIHRTTRRLSPTHEGAGFAQHVERILEEIDRAEQRLANGRDEPHGVLRVTAPVSFGRIRLAPILAELVAQHAALSVELKLDDAIVDLVDDRIDVAIRIGPPRDSRAVMRKLADNHRILCAAPSYLDRVGRPSHPSDAVGLTFLRYGDGNDPWRLETAGGESFDLAAPTRLRADSGDAVYDWALAGHGVMLKSLIDVLPDLRSQRLERVLPRWQTAPAPLYALLPSRAQLPLKTRALLDLLVARFASAPS